MHGGRPSVLMDILVLRSAQNEYFFLCMCDVFKARIKLYISRFVSFVNLPVILFMQGVTRHCLPFANAYLLLRPLGATAGQADTYLSS